MGSVITNSDMSKLLKTYIKPLGKTILKDGVITFESNALGSLLTIILDTGIIELQTSIYFEEDGIFTLMVEDVINELDKEFTMKEDDDVVIFNDFPLYKVKKPNYIKEEDIHSVTFTKDLFGEIIKILTPLKKYLSKSIMKESEYCLIEVVNHKINIRTVNPYSWSIDTLPFKENLQPIEQVLDKQQIKVIDVLFKKTSEETNFGEKIIESNSLNNKDVVSIKYHYGNINKGISKELYKIENYK